MAQFSLAQFWLVNGILLRNLPSSVNENISNQGREGAGGTWSESEYESEPEPEPEPEHEPEPESLKKLEKVWKTLKFEV